ncbi:MAG: hypothetical protein ACE5FT_04965, partial [Candidatus Nanoarchaeia archaeon]
RIKEIKSFNMPKSFQEGVVFNPHESGFVVTGKFGTTHVSNIKNFKGADMRVDSRGVVYINNLPITTEGGEDAGLDYSPGRKPMVNEAELDLPDKFKGRVIVRPGKILVPDGTTVNLPKIHNTEVHCMSCTVILKSTTQTRDFMEGIFPNGIKIEGKVIDGKKKNGKVKFYHAGTSGLITFPEAHVVDMLDPKGSTVQVGMEGDNTGEWALGYEFDAGKGRHVLNTLSFTTPQPELPNELFNLALGVPSAMARVGSMKIGSHRIGEPTTIHFRDSCGGPIGDACMTRDMNEIWHREDDLGGKVMSVFADGTNPKIKVNGEEPFFDDAELQLRQQLAVDTSVAANTDETQAIMDKIAEMIKDHKFENAQKLAQAFDVNSATQAAIENLIKVNRENPTLLASEGVSENLIYAGGALSVAGRYLFDAESIAELGLANAGIGLAFGFAPFAAAISYGTSGTRAEVMPNAPSEIQLNVDGKIRAYDVVPITLKEGSWFQQEATVLKQGDQFYTFSYNRIGQYILDEAERVELPGGRYSIQPGTHHVLRALGVGKNVLPPTTAERMKFLMEAQGMTVDDIPVEDTFGDTAE